MYWVVCNYFSRQNFCYAWFGTGNEVFTAYDNLMNLLAHRPEESYLVDWSGNIMRSQTVSLMKSTR